MENTNKKDDTIKVEKTTVAKVSKPSQEKTTKGLDNPLDLLYATPTEQREYDKKGKFHIPEGKKDDRFIYAFPLISQVNDKKRDGWHVYKEVMSGSKVGSTTEFFGSLDDDLKEDGHICMIKKKESYEADMKNIQAETSRQEESIKTDAENIKGNYGEIKSENKAKIKL